MASQYRVEEGWLRLALMDPVDRVAEMKARYSALAQLPEEERRTSLREMVKAEFSLPDEELRGIMLFRMRTWLALDPEKARIVAASFDGVMKEMSAPMAMRRVALVQKLVMDFSVEEEERLRDLIPGAFAGAPGRITGLERPEEPLRVQEKAAKRRWWRFRR
jgi:hypothetical protein